VQHKIDPTFSDHSALSLDGALQLLQQSGHALPDPGAGRDAWLQAVIDGVGCQPRSLTGLREPAPLSSRSPARSIASRAPASRRSC
jgi:hypothetical protein